MRVITSDRKGRDGGHIGSSPLHHVVSMKNGKRHNGRVGRTGVWGAQASGHTHQAKEAKQD